MAVSRPTASGADERTAAAVGAPAVHRRFLSASEELSAPPAPRAPGQAFTDLLLLGALACQAPVALLSVPQPDGSWSALQYGLDTRVGCNDPQIFLAIAASVEPVEFANLVTSLPRSPLVGPPHSLRWAYGVALRQESGSVIGVAVVLDRWLREVSKREQRALAALARQLGAELLQWRQPGDPSRAGLADQAGRAAGADVFPHPFGAVAPGQVRPPGPAQGAGPVPRDDVAVNGNATLLSGRHHLLRSHEVAEVFDVTERTVINWAAAGKLPSLRTIGGHLRFRREDVLRLLAPPEIPPAG